MHSPTAPTPTFSVIIPAYKVEEYLAECIDSVLAQTVSDFELLVVNDGSPDGSPAIAERYAEKDSRVRLINQQNQGVAVARNNGVSQAKGRYIIHVDADDIIHPQLLEICQHYLSRYGAEAVCFDHQRIAPHAGMPTPTLQAAKLRHHCSHNPIPLLRQRHPYRISVMAVMTCCSAELARSHPFLPGIKYDDYPYVSTLVKDINCCVILRTPLYGYTARPGSVMMSNFTTDHIAHHRRALLFIADTYAPEPGKLAAVAPTIFPEILKQIGNNIFRAETTIDGRTAMLRDLRSLLTELNNRGLFTWRGHKLRRYFAFRKLLRTPETELTSLIPALSKIFH